MNDCPIVSTSNGLMKGKVTAATDPSAKPVFTYLGIPYGKPPVKNLRFLPSEKPDSWEGVFDAVHNFKLCPQVTSVAFLYDELIPYKNSMDHDDHSSTEDCLKMNVFTTKCEKDAKMPVMVWLTGGHYQRNFGGRRNGTPLAGMNDCVIVVPNFRVNAFGYFSLGKGSCCPGNAALSDIILCLKWVRDNIEAFGGDSNNVTLFGESSGSGMVHSLMMSELSKGLFHKAILMSGTVMTPFLFNERIDVVRDIFLETLGLDMKSMKEDEILEKLQEMPVEKIMEGQQRFDAQNIFMPTVDGHIIKDTPANLIKSGQVHKVPLLLGCTNSEGSGMLSMRIIPEYEKGLSEEAARNIFADTFQKIYSSNQGATIFEFLKKIYSKQLDQNSETRFSQLHGEIFSDTVFVVPSVMTVSAHSCLGNSTYFYQMTQRPEFNHSVDNGPGVKKRPDFVKCDHADDLHFLWGVAFEEGELSGGAHFTDEEVEFSRYVMRYFTNFAKSGNPNKPVDVPLQWPSYDVKEKQHMVLQMPLKTSHNLSTEKIEFFTETLPNMAAKQR